MGLAELTPAGAAFSSASARRIIAPAAVRRPTFQRVRSTMRPGLRRSGQVPGKALEFRHLLCYSRTASEAGGVIADSARGGGSLRVARRGGGGVVVGGGFPAEIRLDRADLFPVQDLRQDGRPHSRPR